MMDITLYHNPGCGTSRKVLQMIREAGIEPRVIEYLKTPPARAELIEIIRRMGKRVRGLLREKAPPYQELNLADPKWTDDELIDFLLAHPILMNRPVVVTPQAAKLCRPAETVFQLLEVDEARAAL